MKTPKDIGALSETQLRSLRARIDAEGSACCDAMIAAGRGRETNVETWVKRDGDALTLRWQNWSRFSREVTAEEKRRLEWHGSFKRIKARF